MKGNKTQATEIKRTVTKQGIQVALKEGIDKMKWIIKRKRDALTEVHQARG